MYYIYNQCDNFIKRRKFVSKMMRLFRILVLNKPKKGVLTGLSQFNCVKNDKICEDCFDFSLANIHQILEFFQGDGFVFQKMVEEKMLGLGEGDFGESSYIVGNYTLINILSATRFSSLKCTNNLYCP